MTVVISVLAFAAVLGTALAVPLSPTRRAFRQIVASASRSSSEGLFTDALLQDLPSPVRRHIEVSGFVGTPVMATMVADHADVSFLLSPGKPPIKIRYIQVNRVDDPLRVSFISARLYGLPFEALDSYVSGTGRMRGSLAKVIPAFDESGTDMSRAQLATILSEALVVPSIALAPYVTWEPIDATRARARITAHGLDATGIFTFGDDGLAESFRTDDRAHVTPDGTSTPLPWSLTTTDYGRVDGLLLPGRVCAVWHEPESDSVYFDSRGMTVRYLAGPVPETPSTLKI